MLLLIICYLVILTITTSFTLHYFYSVCLLSSYSCVTVLIVIFFFFFLFLFLFFFFFFSSRRRHTRYIGDWSSDVCSSDLIILDDVPTADVVNPLLHEKGLQTLLGVPLVGREGAIGVVHVGTYAARVFTPADVELLSLVAQRAALAIAKARLHDEIIRLDELKLNFV